MSYLVHPGTWTDTELSDVRQSLQIVSDYSYDIDNASFNCCKDCQSSAIANLARYMNRLEVFECRISLLCQITICATHDEAFNQKALGDRITPFFTYDEIAQWHERESQRFARGTYIPVPWEAIEPSNANRFVHIELTDPGMVSYTQSDEHGVHDRQTKINAGRYLQKFFGDSLTPAQIRDYTSQLQGSTYTLQFATSADDIEQIYKNGPNSCMAHGGRNGSYDYASHIHPVRVYGDSDLQLAWYGIKSRPSGRAIVWPEKKIYQRLYGGEETLGQLLAAHGYRKGSLAGAHIRAVFDSNNQTYVVPYVDGIGCGEVVSVIRNGKRERMIKLGSGDLDLQRTDGLAGDPMEDDSSDDDGYDPDYDDNQ